MLFSGDRVAVINLSINKLSGSSLIPGNETIQKLMRTLKYPEFKVCSSSALQVYVFWK